MGLFILKIDWYLAWALLVVALDFLSSGGDSNHRDGGPFCNLGYFFDFCSFRGNLSGCMTFSYPHRHSPITMLFPADFLQPWPEQRQKVLLRHS
jgi:hypothetical protein